MGTGTPITVATAQIKVVLNTDQFRPMIEKMVQTRTTKVNVKVERSDFDQWTRATTASLITVGRLARAVSSALKGFAVAGAGAGLYAVHAFLKQGSTEALVFQNHIGGIKDALAGIGEKVLSSKIALPFMSGGKKDAYQWTSDLAAGLKKVDSAQVQLFVNVTRWLAVSAVYVQSFRWIMRVLGEVGHSITRAGTFANVMKGFSARNATKNAAATAAETAATVATVSGAGGLVGFRNLRGGSANAVAKMAATETAAIAANVTLAASSMAMASKLKKGAKAVDVAADSFITVGQVTAMYKQRAKSFADDAFRVSSRQMLAGSNIASRTAASIGGGTFAAMSLPSLATAWAGASASIIAGAVTATAALVALGAAAWAIVNKKDAPSGLSSFVNRTILGYDPNAPGKQGPTYNETPEALRYKSEQALIRQAASATEDMERRERERAATTGKPLFDADSGPNIARYMAAAKATNSIREALLQTNREMRENQSGTEDFALATERRVKLEKDLANAKSSVEANTIKSQLAEVQLQLEYCVTTTNAWIAANKRNTDLLAAEAQQLKIMEKSGGELATAEFIRTERKRKEAEITADFLAEEEKHIRAIGDAELDKARAYSDVDIRANERIEELKQKPGSLDKSSGADLGFAMSQAILDSMKRRLEMENVIKKRDQDFKGIDVADSPQNKAIIKAREDLANLRTDFKKALADLVKPSLELDTILKQLIPSLEKLAAPVSPGG